MNLAKSSRLPLSASRTLAIAILLPSLALAACTQSGSPSATGSANPQATASSGTDATPDTPKVPYANQPCRTFSTSELKKLGFAANKPFQPGRDPDRLPFDNSCDFGDMSVEYTSRKEYQDQKDMLRSSRRTPPADLPDAFYDTLGNLWFSKNGYYVVIPNTISEAGKEKVARAIAAKL